MNSGAVDDLVEIRKLVDAYAAAMDDSDLDAFPRLFVPDGALVVRVLGRDDPVATFTGPGPDGIGLIARMMRDLYAATTHHVTTHDASIDGERATGTTYCLAHHLTAEDNPSLETLCVRYVEEFVNTDGGWKMRVRDVTRLWSQIAPAPRTPLLLDRTAAHVHARDGRPPAHGVETE